MAAPILRKKFRIELEYEVSIDEIDEENTNSNIPPQAIPYLKQLQAALLNDETALLKAIQARLVSQLQNYADDLSGQDTLNDLRRLDSKLETEEISDLCSLPLDFSFLTWPIRISTMNACLSSSTLSEEQRNSEGNPTWQLVWSDLRPRSPFGQWIAPSENARSAISGTLTKVSDHYFLLHYISRQGETIQAEASCACGLTFDGTGAEEGLAIEAAWVNYKQHLEAFGVGTDPEKPAQVSLLQN